MIEPMWYVWLPVGLVLGAGVGVLVAGLMASAGREDDRMMERERMLGLLRQHHHDRLGACPYCPHEWSELR
jgi:hypothetical protein